MAKIEIKVPDIGGYDDVPVIEVLVAVGDAVRQDQGLVTLESDKATMEVPASASGTIAELKVKVGDTVSEGAVIAVLETGDGGEAKAEPGSGDEDEAGSKDEARSEAKVESEAKAKADAKDEGTAQPEGKAKPEGEADGSAPPAPRSGGEGRGEGGSRAEDRSGKPPAPTTPAPRPAAATGRKADIECALVVVGAGPGGYTAAFRAADLGLDTVLVERYPQLGGVCLNVGCIPSKALLHAAEVIDLARHAGDYGVEFGEPKVSLDKLREYKDKVVGQLTKGLSGMAKQRKVRVVAGSARFVSGNELEIDAGDGKAAGAKPQLLRFEQCIIAAGSQPVKLPGFPWDDERVMDSTDALALADIPKKLLVVGGGIIGLEMATVFGALGSAVTVVELADQLMPGADPDLVKPLAARLKQQGMAVHLKTRVVEAKAQKNGIACTFEGASIPDGKLYDRVLVAVGRAPNGGRLDAGKAGVQVDERGFIPVDRQMRTNVPQVLAIGDLVGNPMLAHKASHEGKLAAEVAAGHKREWVARVVPSVAYTDPEIAWVGVTEGEARQKGLKVGIGRFPWAASGRAIGLGRTEGMTKLLFDEATHRIVGGGIVGPHAGDLIAEVALAIEMGAEAADIGHTIHPHPTLGESVAMAAEVYEGTITDLYIPKKK